MPIADGGIDADRHEEDQLRHRHSDRRNDVARVHDGARANSAAARSYATMTLCDVRSVVRFESATSQFAGHSASRRLSAVFVEKRRDPSRLRSAFDCCCAHATVVIQCAPCVNFVFKTYAWRRVPLLRCWPTRPMIDNDVTFVGVECVPMSRKRSIFRLCGTSCSSFRIIA